MCVLLIWKVNGWHSLDTEYCKIVEDLMFFSPLWIQLFIVHGHWTWKCNFLLSHFILTNEYILTIHDRRLVIWWHLNHGYSMEPVYKACLPILHISMYGTRLLDDINKWCSSVTLCFFIWSCLTIKFSCYKSPCTYKFLLKSMLLQQVCTVFYKLFYSPKVSVFTYLQHSAENVNWISVVLWIRLLYMCLFNTDLQICWYWRISIFVCTFKVYQTCII